MHTLLRKTSEQNYYTLWLSSMKFGSLYLTVSRSNLAHLNKFGAAVTGSKCKK